MALSRIDSTSSGGTSPLRSTSSSCGYSSLVTKACTVRTIDSCSSSSWKSMSLLSSRPVGAPDAHRSAGTLRPGQRLVGVADGAEPVEQVGRHVGGPAGRGVHVDQQLLRGGEQVAGVAVPHLLVEVHAPGVVVEQLEGHRQRLPLGGLPTVVEVRLTGVEGMTGRTVVLVDADEAEEGVRVVPEDQQEAGLAHVP